MSKIFSTIIKEWNDYINNDVEIVDGYTFNQYDTIKRIHKYYNSQFENGSQYNGRDKIFFNISKYRCIVASKMLNFDTKDIRLWPLNPSSEIATFLLEKELAQWMKKNKMGKILNQAADEAPIYGTIIFRKIKGGVKIVDLRRIAMDPTVESIQDSRFISLKHYLTEPELRAKIKDGWDESAIKALIERKGREQAKPAYEQNGQVNQTKCSPYFEVYERFGEVELEEITGKEKDEEKVRSIFIVAEPDDKNNDGLVLFKSEWKGDYPFKDFHYSKTKGRYLGIGVIEDLFSAQERQNEMANQKRVSMEISGMHVFQTQGKSALGNILSDLNNGDVLATGINGAITPIPTEERNLPAFNDEQSQYDQLADRLSFAYDAVRGESLPASTPVTNTVIQNNNANSVFAYKRENLGLTLQDLFNDIVLPQLVKDLSKEHILRFMGSVEDIRKLDGIVSKNIVRNAVMERLLNGQIVVEEDLARIQSEVASQLKERGAQRFVDIVEGFYKQADFEFDFMVTNEQENVSGMATNLMSLVTALAQNPQMLDNPIVKTLLYEYAQKIGISPIKLEQADVKQNEGQMGPMEQIPQAPQMNAQSMAALMGANQPVNV